MSRALTEHQWHLTHPDDETAGIVFGTADTGIQTKSAPDLGQRGIRVYDTALPREDGIGFGPDYGMGSTITFEANVLTDGVLDQVDLLDALEIEWRSPKYRRDPRDYAILRSCVAGRIRRCYGRPRRFAEVDGNLTHEGYTGVVFDFATVDSRFYDDVEVVKELPIVPETMGGFRGPLTDPITGEIAGEEHGRVTVVGMETWVVVTIEGPVTNPSVDFGDFTLSLDAVIPDGISVTIDPRPWSRGVFRSDGASMAGTLTFDSPPLRRLQMDPGSYLVAYRGTDETGTSKCYLSWRPAHARP